MKRLFISAALMGTIFLANAQTPESFSYKGVKIGDSLDSFQAALPYFKCSSSECTYSAASCEMDLKAKGSGDTTRNFDTCMNANSYGGAFITFGMAKFHEGKLSEIYLTSPWMSRINSALVEKYGQPSSIDNTPVQNKMGAEFDNWVKTWKMGSDQLVAKLRAGSVKEGSVLILGEAAMKLRAKQQQEQAKSGAKDF